MIEAVEYDDLDLRNSLANSSGFQFTVLKIHPKVLEISDISETLSSVSPLDLDGQDQKSLAKIDNWPPYSVRTYRAES